MKKKSPLFDINEIPQAEQTPTVKLLLSVIETLQTALLKQSSELEIALAELRRLKKLKEKPKLRASKLPKNPDDDSTGSSGNNTAKESHSKKKCSKNKNLIIDKEIVIAAEDVPEGSIHKGYQSFVVQDLEINPVVTQYRRERWLLPDGSYQTAKLPEALNNQHFGPVLRAYVLHQYHHQSVTQPLLYDQLCEWKIVISKGQLNRLLIENKQIFHEEKKALLSTGLSISSYIQVDDTGARHQGMNGYCTHIGNDFFAWFESKRRKSRVNFLELLQLDNKGYRLTRASFSYMKKNKVTSGIREKLKDYSNKKVNKEIWEKILKRLNITTNNSIRLVTEAALIGHLLFEGLSKDLCILSDDAGQFNVFQHALCWIHAERAITTLIPACNIQIKAINWARQEVWEIYHLLLDYKTSPSLELKSMIRKRFNSFVLKKTDSGTLNLILKRFRTNKTELLMVLNRPEIPLHNNLSERDIREYVKRRKISGSTRSNEGRQCRDTFASLKKTAKKLNVGFWDYLIDRISLTNAIPSLSVLMEKAAANSRTF